MSDQPTAISTGVNRNAAGEPPPDAATFVDESTPIPPRYWWLKTLLLTTAILVALLINLRLWWGWAVHRRFEAEVAKLAAAGGPVWPSDEDSARLFEKDGFVMSLDAAAAALNLTGADNDLIRKLQTPRLDSQVGGPALAAFVQRNAEALRLAREAVKCEWPGSTSRALYPTDDLGAPWVGTTIPLCFLLPAAALHEHAMGNDRESVAIIHDYLRITDALGALPSELGPFLWYTGRGMMLRCIETHSATLSVSSGTVDIGTSASSEQIAALIEDLAGPSYAERIMHRENVLAVALRADAICKRARGGLGIPRGFRAAGAATTWNRLAASALAPAVETRGVRMLQPLSAYVEAAKTRTFPQAMARCPRQTVTVDNPGISLIPARGWALYPLESTFAEQFTYLANRRMAAAALAIRWYEVDHGRRPETLDELVPRYLPSVPLDPFAYPERPIGYRPHAERPLLYSVGENGVDDNGGSGVQGRYQRTLPDLVFFLDSDRREEFRDRARVDSTDEVDDNRDAGREGQQQRGDE